MRLKLVGICLRLQSFDVVNKHVPRRAEVDHLAGEIRIDSGMMHSKQEQSLFHEILHEVDQQCATSLNEETVSRLAESLFDVIKYNGLYFGLDRCDEGKNI